LQHSKISTAQIIRAKGGLPVRTDEDKLALAFAFVSFVSSTLIGCMVVGYFAGIWVDNHFGTYPSGRVGGVALAVALAVWAVVMHLREYFIKHPKDKE
jgi:F0F1-type ATP synthase assembly protein I